MTSEKKSTSINQFIEAASHVFSALFSPLLMPTYGVFLVLWCSFALKLQFAKGNKLVAFRRNVTRGLLTRQTKTH